MLTISFLFDLLTFIFLLAFLHYFFPFRYSLHQIFLYSFFIVPCAFRNRISLVQNAVFFVLLWTLCNAFYQGGFRGKFFYFSWCCFILLTARAIILLLFTQFLSFSTIAPTIEVLLGMILCTQILNLSFSLVFVHLKNQYKQILLKGFHSLFYIPYILLCFFYIFHMDYGVFYDRATCLVFLYLIQVAALSLVARLFFWQQALYQRKLIRLQQSNLQLQCRCELLYQAYSSYFDHIHDLLYQCLCLERLSCFKQYNLLQKQIKKLAEHTFSHFQNLYRTCPVLKTMLEKEEKRIQKQQLRFDTTQLDEEKIQISYAALQSVYQSMLQVLFQCCEKTTITIQNQQKVHCCFLQFTFSSFCFDETKLSLPYEVYISRDSLQLYHVTFLIPDL